jgi:hypothetical protein
MAQWSKYDSEIGKALNKNPDINNQKLAEKLLGLKRKRSGDSVDLLRTYIARFLFLTLRQRQTKVTFGGFGSRTSKQVLSLKIGSFFLGVLSGCLRMRYIVLGLR